MDMSLAPILTVLSGAFDYAKNTAVGNALIQSAQRKQIQSQVTADQLDVNAGQQQAAASYAVAEQKRIGDLGMSSLMARVAMQGGQTNDPSTMMIRSRILQEQAYREALAMYQGNENARGMRNQAAGIRYQGDTTMEDAQIAKRSADMAGVSGLVKTGASLYEKYNKDAPNVVMQTRGGGSREVPAFGQFEGDGLWQ